MQVIKFFTCSLIIALFTNYATAQFNCTAGIVDISAPASLLDANGNAVICSDGSNVGQFTQAAPVGSESDDFYLITFSNGSPYQVSSDMSFDVASANVAAGDTIFITGVTSNILQASAVFQQVYFDCFFGGITCPPAYNAINDGSSDGYPGLDSAVDFFAFLDAIFYPIGGTEPFYNTADLSIEEVDSIIVALNLDMQSSTITDDLGICHAFSNTLSVIVDGVPQSGCTTQNLNFSPTICGGDYTLADGTIVNAPGTYTVSLTDCLGCTTNYNYNIQGSGNTDTLLNVEACNPITIAGTTLYQSGTYTVDTSTLAGCDSTITIDFDLVNSISNSVFFEYCDGEMHTFGDGTTTTTQGAFNFTYQSAGGCDSIVLEAIVFHASYDTTVQQFVCEGTVLPDGTVVGTSDILVTLNETTQFHGCDSIVNLFVTPLPTYEETIDVSFCESVSYELPDGSVVYDEGTYTVTLPTIDGCDSLLTVNITNSLNYSFDITDVIYEGEYYTLPDGQQASAEGIYIISFTTQVGCDSIYTIDLSVITDVEEFGNEQEISVYSLTNSSFNILSNSYLEATVSLIDISGKVLFAKNQNLNAGINNFNIKNSLPQGIYLVNIETLNKTFTKKIKI